MINHWRLALISMVLMLGWTVGGCSRSEPFPDERSPSMERTCDRSAQMDRQYCDRNQDLVADTPELPSEQVNPETLVFAYLPIKDAGKYEPIWTEFIEHLSEITGKPVKFLALESNSEQLKALRDGQLHIAGFSTSTVPVAVNQAGFIPFAMMASSDGSFGYEMEIITHTDSQLQNLEDLPGHQLAFTTSTSYSGYILPRVLLEAGYNLKDNQDYEAIFSGSQEDSILGVQNREYDAGAIANDVLQLMCHRQEADCSQFRTLYQSQTFPNAGYGYAYNLAPKLIEKIQNAFLTFDWSGSGLEREFAGTGEDKFITIDYQIDWGEVRTIQDAQGVEYEIN